MYNEEQVLTGSGPPDTSTGNSATQGTSGRSAGFASGLSSPGTSATIRTHIPKRSRSGIVRPGSGIMQDIRARALWYRSDWTDAWNYRVIPATALIFFANVLPGIAFSLDLIETTQQYGVAEVLISSFMAAFIFSVFGAQPLTIAGVTGPITVFNKTIYTIIIQGQTNPPQYLHFVGWVYLWAAIFHWISAILNWCNFLRYVTLFPCDTFGFYVSWVYLQYGVQVITREFTTSPINLDGAFVSVILALLMLVASFLFQVLSHTTYFHRHVRRFFADYGMPISLIASSGMAYWGQFNNANPSTLPINGAFQAANGRAWLVRFWELDGKWVGIALPFGFVLWVLFFFDHNVSSLMAQGAQFPLRKPPGFHYDFFLLGISTFIAGLIGVPAPNGLIPQAPIHTSSLLIMGQPLKKDFDEEDPVRSRDPSRFDTASSSKAIFGSKNEKPVDLPTARDEVPIAVVEQRVSNLAQGSLCLVLLTGPFLHILNLVPRGVLAGLFWFMGVDALRGNGITNKLLYLIRDKSLTPHTDPLRNVRKSRLIMFVSAQLIGFGATFAVTQTIAAIGFPVIILLLVPLRTLVIPRLPFTAEELAILDGPTASPFVSIFFPCAMMISDSFIAIFSRRLMEDNGIGWRIILINMVDISMLPFFRVISRSRHPSGNAYLSAGRRPGGSGTPSKNYVAGLPELD